MGRETSAAGRDDTERSDFECQGRISADQVGMSNDGNEKRENQRHGQKRPLKRVMGRRGKVGLCHMHQLRGRVIMKWRCFRIGVRNGLNGLMPDSDTTMKSVGAWERERW